MSIESEGEENVNNEEAEAIEDDSFDRQDSLLVDVERRGEYTRSVSDEFRQTWTNSFRRRTNTFRKLLRNVGSKRSGRASDDEQQARQKN